MELLSYNKYLVALFFLSSSFILSGCPGNAIVSDSKSSSVYGVDITGRKVVFVTDISLSMEGKAETGASSVVRDKTLDGVTNKLPSWLRKSVKESINKGSSKLSALKKQLSSAITQLPDSVHFNIVAFSGTTKQWSNKLNAATKGNKASALHFVKKLSGEPYTSIDSGLKKAFQFPADQIILITDGEDTRVSPTAILTSVAHLNKHRKIIIHTIGLGKDQDEKFLKALAAQNGGKYARRSSLF